MGDTVDKWVYVWVWGVWVWVWVERKVIRWMWEGRERVVLTSKSTRPNSRQKMRGPARSVSFIILGSVLCSGFSTDSVYNGDITNRKSTKSMQSVVRLQAYEGGL